MTRRVEQKKGGGGGGGGNNVNNHFAYFLVSFLDQSIHAYRVQYAHDPDR